MREARVDLSYLRGNCAPPMGLPIPLRNEIVRLESRDRLPMDAFHHAPQPPHHAHPFTLEWCLAVAVLPTCHPWRVYILVSGKASGTCAATGIARPSSTPVPHIPEPLVPDPAPAADAIEAMFEVPPEHLILGPCPGSARIAPAVLPAPRSSPPPGWSDTAGFPDGTAVR